MPDLTEVFNPVFDAIRQVVTTDADQPLIPLTLDDGPVDEPITTGWILEPISDGTGNKERQLLLTITDKPGMDNWVKQAERFQIDRTVYERQGSFSPPDGNPQVWTCLVVPVRIRPKL